MPMAHMLAMSGKNSEMYWSGRRARSHRHTCLRAIQLLVLAGIVRQRDALGDAAPEIFGGIEPLWP